MPPKLENWQKTESRLKPLIDPEKQITSCNNFKMQLVRFKKSTVEYIQFSNKLNNKQRKKIHFLARDLELKTKSVGKEPDRVLFVMKPSFMPKPVTEEPPTPDIPDMMIVDVKSSEDDEWGCHLDQWGSFLVTKVDPGSQMHRLGIRAGDQLYSVNGKKITEIDWTDSDGPIQKLVMGGLACVMEFERPACGKRKRDEDEAEAKENTATPALKKMKMTPLPPLVLSDQADFALVQDLQNFISRTWGFKKLTDEGKELIRKIGELHGATMAQAKSAWNTLGSANAAKNDSYLQHLIEKLDDTGEGLENLRVDVPPLNIVRRFVRCKLKWSKNRTKKLIAFLSNGWDINNPDDGLDEALFQKFKQLAKLDGFTGKTTTDHQKTMANERENEVYAWLKAKGVPFATENDIREAAAGEENQQGIATPDVLFPTTVTLNGSEGLRWLEIKNYYGSLAASERRVNSVESQVKRYQDKFGPGILVFSLGYAAGFPKRIKCPCLTLK